MTAAQLAAALAIGAVGVGLWRFFGVGSRQHSQCQCCQQPIEPDEIGICDECWRNLQW